MKTYAWTCLACDRSQSADVERCGACGCPSRATAAQVEAARSARRQHDGSAPVQSAETWRVMARLPLLPIGAALLALAGGALLVVAMSIAGSGSAAAFGGLLLALAALCLSSWRPAAPALNR